MEQRLVFDPKLIARYDQPGPRYTSYPTAVQFTADFSSADYRKMAAQSNTSGKALSLYFHLPFCDTVCFYCACNKVVTKDRSQAASYLIRLYREIEMQADLFDPARVVRQLHWGGGTPTFINHEQMRELMRVTASHFQLLDNDAGEYSIEIDPREADRHTMALLRDLGFNRVSLGVQDFEEPVQRAVNRVQSVDQTWAVLDAARKEGFRSISLDLIYGLPHQTVVSFARTLDRVISFQPDRLSVFNYAHLPERFKPQRRINADALPTPNEKLDIFRVCGEKLAAAGYVYIGMDHFALPDDELAVAQRENTLYRNFQGYSTHADCDLIGLGVTAIGMVDSSYAQNAHALDEYYALIDSGRLAISRGLILGEDDLLRRDVITHLICHFALDFDQFEAVWQIDFAAYFYTELATLEGMARDGLLQLHPKGIEVLPRGRLLIRNVCMVFDRYLKAGEERQRFSRVI